MKQYSKVLINVKQYMSLHIPKQTSLLEMVVKWNNLWHDGCRMWSRICLHFQNTWFHLWFS